MTSDRLLVHAIVTALIACASCYDPIYSNCNVSCDAIHGCPGGLTCAAGWCARDHSKCIQGTSDGSGDREAINGPDSDGSNGDAEVAHEDATGDSAEVGLDGRLPIELPAGTSGLELWLDANLGADEGPPFVWSDLSDAHNDARQGGLSHPTVGIDTLRNSSRYVHFNGLEDFLSVGVGFSDLQNGLTIFVVARPDVSVPSGGNAPFMDLGRVPNNTADSVILSRTGKDDTGLAFTTWIGNATLAAATDFPGALVNGQWSLIELVFSGGKAGSIGTYRMRTSSTADFSEGSCYVPNVVVRSSNLIGASNAPTNAGVATFHGDLALLVVYSRAISDDERLAMETYLREKEGL